MKYGVILIAGLCGAALPVLAETPLALQPGLVQVAERTGAEAGAEVILFAAGPEGRVGGDVVTGEGSLLCAEAWTAQAAAEGQALRFSAITLSATPCAEGAALQDFAARLARVVALAETEEGTELRDAQGQPLLRLKVAG